METDFDSVNFNCIIQQDDSADNFVFDFSCLWVQEFSYNTRAKYGSFGVQIWNCFFNEGFGHGLASMAFSNGNLHDKFLQGANGLHFCHHHVGDIHLCVNCCGSCHFHLD
jgi:hypothetical protein